MPKPRTVPIRNTALQRRIGDTGLPYRRIAAEINKVAAENGHATRCTAGVIANWLAGRTPMLETIRVTVEAFRRLLGTPHLSAHDLGWEIPDGFPVDDPWGADPITWLAQVGRDDMADTDRRAVLFSLVATLPALNVPATSPHASGMTRAGTADARRIREMTQVFSDMDLRFGGGHARSAVAAYLTRHVVPLLRGAAGRGRPAVFTAAAELAYLAGFMAADDRAAGAAQRYYIQALRLADEADDYRMRATVLRAMALQSVELGHPSRGRELAEAAARTLPSGAPARLQSWVTAMIAQAAAAEGAARSARELLRSAERHLARSSPGPASWTGAYDLVALQHQTGMALASYGDLEPAEEHLAGSLARRPTTQRRSRALIGARLALLQARRHNPSAAAHTIQMITSDLQLVESARVAQELRALRSTWCHARNETAVEAADQTVANLLRVRDRRRPL